MSNDDTKRGSSILNSLKKLIFEDDQPQQTPPAQAPPAPATNAAPERPHVPPAYTSPTAQAPTGKTLRGLRHLESYASHSKRVNRSMMHRPKEHLP